MSKKPALKLKTPQKNHSSSSKKSKYKPKSRRHKPSDRRTVEPIRDMKVVQSIENMLLSQNNMRDFMLWTFGINTALRISDLLSIKINDVFDSNLQVRDFIYLHYSKRKKNKIVKITLNDKLKKSLADYMDWRLKNNIYSEWLFYSKRTQTNPTDRHQVYRNIKNWAKTFNIKQAIGTHTLRKTWGYIAFKYFHIPIEIICEKLHHTHPAVTRRYLGITDDMLGEVEKRVQI